MENKVEIIGLGYVGYPLALQTAYKGYETIGYDKNEKTINAIDSGICPITTDKHIESLFQKVKIHAVSEILPADIFIVCVPTPVKKNHLPDLSYIVQAVEDISRVLVNDNLVIIESTIYPGVCDDIIAPILNSTGLEYHLAHCPERINPGDTQWNVSNIPRVVSGNSPIATKRAQEFYSSIIDAEIKPLSQLKAAEATKILENTFRDINIAFINEMAQSFHRLGIDISEVIKGASTKPFAFLPHYPGIGVGGHCIAVDPYYMIEKGKEVGFEHAFLSLARKINSNMPLFAVQVIQDGLNDIGKCIKGSRITILGLSYKPNVRDIRESPTEEVLKLLKEKSADICLFDPYFPENSDAESLADAVKDADCVLLATAHDCFTKNLAEYTGVPLFIDGRNVLDKNEMQRIVNIYRGIGINY